LFLPHARGRDRLARHHAATVEPPVWLRVDSPLAEDDPLAIRVDQQKVGACLESVCEGLAVDEMEVCVVCVVISFVMQSSATPGRAANESAQTDAEIQLTILFIG